MRIRSPASRGSFQFRVAKFDLFVAVITPWLALVVRDHNVFIDGRGTATVYYFTVSLFFSFCAFLLFRIRDGLSRFFSVHDAWAVVKAVILSELMTGMVLFTLTRLDGIPRSTPVIHALLLTAFLIGSRVAVRMLDRKSKSADLSQLLTEHIIMIGATARSSQYINLIAAETPGRQEVVAVLDERAEMIDRSISGIKVEGLPERLSSLIAEYAEHGIRIDRVIIGDESGQTPKASLKNIRQVCRQSAIALDSLPALTRLKNLQPASPNAGRDMIKRFASSIETSRYFKIKRLVDFIAATILFIVLMPLILLVAIIVLFDVGSPLMFWQRRVGAEGRRFQLYKFRTLKPSYDQEGQPIPESERLSGIGKLLRRSCLDELPQLFNVLVGDMALVGPRPLLPQDQPPNPAMRLRVRPGMTGWAQINGGQMLASRQKAKLDEWYVRNAAFRIDLRILLLTIRFIARRFLGGDLIEKLPPIATAARDRRKFRSSELQRDKSRRPVNNER